MRRCLILIMTLTLGVGGGALLGGCGSGTKTVTASNAPAPAGSATTGAANTASTATATTATGTTPRTSATTTPAAPTRTAAEPQFTHSDGAAPSQPGRAVAVLQAHGFTAANTSDYHKDQTLQVLIGTRTGSSDGHVQQAFFFLDGRYLGTDTKQPSGSLRVVNQGDTAITLAYPLYRPHDALCCPSAGHADVRFELDNGKLTPLDAIPPASSATAPSRQ
jgi:LppP/LprE lipoprotein